MEELKKEKNELTTFPKEVKFHNDLNTVSLRNFNKNEIDLFISLCQKFKNQESRILKFNFSEVKQLMNINQNLTNTEISNILKNMYNKLIQCNIKITTQDK